MATTTNYGWTTPDDTALVKDGASAIRTLGSSVDTTTKNLNPETTLADIAYRSSTANVKTRLGIGSTGQVLTVAGGVPTWATPAAGGGMTLLSTTTLSGASTTVSNISQDYQNLLIRIFGATNDTADGYWYVYTNGALDGHNYAGISGSSSADSPFATRNNVLHLGNTGQTHDRTSANNAHQILFVDYTATTIKPFIISGTYQRTAAYFEYNAGGANTKAAAITSITVKNDGGNSSAGTIKIWGIK